MQIYAVGQSYLEYIRPGVNGARIDFDSDNEATVVISDAEPTQQDIEIFQTAKCFRMGLHYYREQILFAFKVDGLWMDWLDMNYCPHLSSPDVQEKLLACRPEGALGLYINYVNSNTGTLLGMHFITSSKQFYTSLIAAIQDKLSRPYDQEKNKRILEDVYRELPNPLAVAEKAEVGFVIADRMQNG